MDVGQAYNRLQIDDHTISDDFVLTAFQLFHQESPSQADDLRSALRAIAKDRNSQTLLNFLDSGMATSEYPLGEWPVGLANIGNTCYLNSLLQFYFTVKPLRELVLNFDQHKMELTAENLVKKVVGSRRISRQEVQRAQSCQSPHPLLKIALADLSPSRLQTTDTFPEHDNLESRSR